MHIIVGSGPMAKEYAKPMIDMDIKFTVIGRGFNSASSFESDTGIKVIPGGIKKYLNEINEPIHSAIVAVGVEELFSVTECLLQNGVTKILVEKPAGLNIEQIELLTKLAKDKSASVCVAYNRRFLGSVIKAEEIIKNDGGVTSFNFELTEWSHVIKGLKKAPGVKEAWFLANTSHVVDLAFFLGGNPSEMTSFVSQPCDWHPSGSNFTGAGRSDNGALFSYSGNWQAPGRWGIEIMTRKTKLILKPIEKLSIQKIGTIKTEEVKINCKYDNKYKPGLYRQLEEFLFEKPKRLCLIEEHLNNTKNYYYMAGYK